MNWKAAIILAQKYQQSGTLTTLITIVKRINPDFAPNYDISHVKVE
jgi:hypothetical protein